MRIKKFLMHTSWLMKVKLKIIYLSSLANCVHYHLAAHNLEPLSLKVENKNIINLYTF